MDRPGWPLRAMLALPWALVGVAVLVMAIADRPAGPTLLAVVPLAATTAALLLARGAGLAR